MTWTDFKEYSSDVQLQIGQRIQKLRIDKKIAAVDLAAVLDIQSNQMSRIENGRANCTVPQLYVISQILGCSVDYLLFGKQCLTISQEQADAYCDRSMTRDYDREGLNAFFATLKEEDFEVVVVRSLNEITDDIFDLEEFVKTITDMGIWLYSLEVGPVPIIVSHAEDFGC